MSGKTHLANLFAATAVCVCIAILAARSAVAGPAFVTDTLGGNGHAKQASIQGYRFITDTLGGNGRPSYLPSAYVHGGAGPTVAQAVQDRGWGRVPAPSATTSTGGSSIDWTRTGAGAGAAAACLLLLASFLRVRSTRRRVLPA
jgi:hypothetical protein